MMEDRVRPVVLLLLLLLLASGVRCLSMQPPDGLAIAHPSRFNTLCVVTANMLYANGYFVRELTADEANELAEYEAEIVDYNRMLEEHLISAAKPASKWIFGGRFILPFEQRTMPRRPAAPLFCTAPDTVVHQLNGCIIQNYRVYIGQLYVRQLNEAEKAELDEYIAEMKEYQEHLIDNMKRQLGTMVSGVWYPYDRVVLRNRNLLFGSIHGVYNSENTTLPSPEETAETSTMPTTTPPPQAPQPPKLCTQIF